MTVGIQVGGAALVAKLVLDRVPAPRALIVALPVTVFLAAAAIRPPVGLDSLAVEVDSWQFYLPEVPSCVWQSHAADVPAEAAELLEIEVFAARPLSLGERAFLRTMGSSVLGFRAQVGTWPSSVSEAVESMISTQRVIRRQDTAVARRYSSFVRYIARDSSFLLLHHAGLDTVHVTCDDWVGVMRIGGHSDANTGS